MARRATLSSRREGVRSLERGLALLELVNEEGGVRPADAARMMKLPRPTAHRLLETLEELGYVRRSSSDNRFLVTSKARGLSAGYDADVHFSVAVEPVLSSLLRDLVWPVNIVTHRGGMMVVRETTHERSPLSIDRAMLGREVPMLRTASGRAYLAFCAQAEREEIVQALRLQNVPEDRAFLTPLAIERLLQATRANGYGTRLGEPLVPKTSSIALPILVDGAARGCITVVWLTSAMSSGRAVRQFVEPLRDAASAIAERVDGAQW